MGFYLDKISGNDKVAFIQKIADVTAQMNAGGARIQAEDLAAVMYHESGFSASITNSIGCTGLIQFCPAPWGGQAVIGKNSAELAAMSRVAQMDDVFVYYKSTGLSGIRSFTDLCLSTFYPAARGKPDSFAFSASVVNANAPLFATGNTLGDYKKYLAKTFPTRFSVVTNPDLRNAVISYAALGLVGAGVGYFFGETIRNFLTFLK